MIYAYFVTFESAYCRMFILFIQIYPNEDSII